MTEFYMLTIACMLGVYTGAAYERGEKIEFADLVLTALLAMLWPITLAASIYVYLAEKSK